VGNTGTLGVWTPANSRISAAGYLYVLGGATDAGGTPTTVLSRGTLAADGSVASWTSDTPLPAALHSLRAVVFNGDLYLVGGSGLGNVPVASVYRSRIGSTGSLGAWRPLVSLPSPHSYFGVGQLGGYPYAFGGDSGTVAPNGAKLKKPMSKGTDVIAAGNALISGGLHNGAKNGASEESYARLNPDGSLGSFNAATGINTIQALGGASLFHHAAVGYVDGRGVFHVLVAGGDDVNSPGTKHAAVYFY
jgi:hypothetical protein